MRSPRLLLLLTVAALLGCTGVCCGWFPGGGSLPDDAPIYPGAELVGPGGGGRYDPTIPLYKTRTPLRRVKAWYEQHMAADWHARGGWEDRGSANDPRIRRRYESDKPWRLFDQLSVELSWNQPHRTTYIRYEWSW